MDRVRRLTAFWNWLPAFRAVAEAEHLPSASEEMHVSASALSRSIRLLEDALEVELFERRGRNLILTDAGRTLLVSVRHAMRVLDDGVELLAETGARGPIRIACPGPFASLFVLPALEALRDTHPELVPVMKSADGERSNQLLLTGDLDLALVDDPVAHSDLVVERLTGIGYGVYCGQSHPLFAVEAPTLEEVQAHRFAAPPSGDDHWPPDVARIVGAELTQLQLGVDFCLAGGYLAVLPDVVAQAAVEHGLLRRLPIEIFESTALYAVYRAPLGTRTKIDIVLPALREVARSGASPRPDSTPPLG